MENLHHANLQMRKKDVPYWNLNANLVTHDKENKKIYL